MSITTIQFSDLLSNYDRTIPSCVHIVLPIVQQHFDPIKITQPAIEQHICYALAQYNCCRTTAFYHTLTRTVQIEINYNNRSNCDFYVFTIRTAATLNDLKW